VIGRRSLLTGLAAAAGGLFLVRDRLPWPPLSPHFANGRDTPWQRIPPGGLIDIEASVNGAPIRAIVDSGAQFSAVDRALSEQLGLPRNMTAPMLAFGVSGGPILTHTVRLDLALPGLTVAGLRAAVLELASVAQVTGRDFSLLIGRDVLRHVVVEADFPLRRTRFLTRGAYVPPPDARTLPLKDTGRGPTLAVQVEESPPLDVLVDTGAAGVLALSESAAQKAGLLAAGRVVSQAHSVSLGGLSLDRRVTARTVRAGGLALQNVDVQIYRPAANAPAPSGLIGTGLFSRYRMALDLGGGRLHLVPPAVMIIR
jgi:predicted aspartyl protease